MQFNNNFNNNFAQKSIQDRQIPVWAMAEGMDRIIALDVLWNCSDKVEKVHSHKVRKGVANLLHKLANLIDEKTESNQSARLQNA